MSKQALLIGSLFLLTVASCWLLRGSAQTFERTYDWTVEIETEEVKNFLDYPGSNMKPMVRARVSYYEGADKGTQSVRYEDLWYRRCDVVGCRRYHTLGLRKGEQIAIRVRHKSSQPSAAETCAVANAVVRLLLDSYLNHNMVSAVLIPADTFSSVAQELHHQNFFPAGPDTPDQPVYASIILHLFSEPPGQEQVMHYAGTTEH